MAKQEPSKRLGVSSVFHNLKSWLFRGTRAVQKVGTADEVRQPKEPEPGEAPDVKDILRVARNRLFDKARIIEDASTGDKELEHDKVAAEVFQRMQMRHAHLSFLVELTAKHAAHTTQGELWKAAQCDASGPALPKEDGTGTKGPDQANTKQDEVPPPGPHPDPVPNPKADGTVPKRTNQENAETSTVPDHVLHPDVRAYHLAVTDLFVEKAISFLERDAAYYKTRGTTIYRWAFGVVAAGTCLAILNMVGQMVLDRLSGEILGADQWPVVVANFARGFTAYGMIVLTAVGLWRYGKALLDQSERLAERRHALRQGRLFVHLNDGKLSITEMEKAFSWNMSQANAFGNLRTEAQAPWGLVLAELAKTSPEIAKSMAEQFSSGFKAASNRPEK